VENELLIKLVYISHTVGLFSLLDYSTIINKENSSPFFFLLLVDHPDVKIQPPVWFCYEYNIRIFGNEMKIPDGSKIKIKVEK
jgi:hypothetical protein